MLVQECYESFGGSYEDVKSRLMRDELIKRFVIKFLDDKSFEQLAEALKAKDYKNAFGAVHTLKGLCRNLSFDKLSVSASKLTETLRKWESVPVDEELCNVQWAEVSADYNQVVNAIRLLEESAD